MTSPPASDQAHDSSSRAGRGQTRWRSAPATTPAPGLRRDALKPLAGAACASLARCAHSPTSPATTLWSTGSPLRLWPGWAISRSQAKRCESLGLGTRRGSMARDFQYRAKKNPLGRKGFGRTMFLGQNHPRKNKRSSNTTEHRCVLVRRHKLEQETPETQGVPWVPDTWPSARGRGRVDRGRNRRLVIAPPAVRNFSDGRASRPELVPACFSTPCPVRTRTTPALSARARGACGWMRASSPCGAA